MYKLNARMVSKTRIQFMSIFFEKLKCLLLLKKEKHENENETNDE